MQAALELIVALGMGALVGFGLGLIVRRDVRVVARWKGDRGSELIDTSDGRRWKALAGRRGLTLDPPMLACEDRERHDLLRTISDPALEEFTRA